MYEPILNRIADSVCYYFKITKMELFSASRKQELVDARTVFGSVAMEYVEHQQRIAEYFGVHHTTVINWFERPRNASVKDGIRTVKSDLKKTIEVFERIQGYVDMQKNLREAQKQKQSLQKQLQRQESIITDIKDEIRRFEDGYDITELYNVMWTD